MSNPYWDIMDKTNDILKLPKSNNFIRSMIPKPFKLLDENGKEVFLLDGKDMEEINSE